MAVESKLIIFVQHFMNLYILLRKNTSTVFKGILALFILFSNLQHAEAQRPYGNEWINYSQPYWKIKVGKDGLYRLNYTDLKAAGVDVDIMQPNYFQLFYRGKQVPIYVKGEEDSIFNNTDFIQFYGLKNDGALDSVLYANPKDQPNPYYSTYTDTSAYFLTWSYDEPLHVKTFNYLNIGQRITTIIEEKISSFNEVYQDGAQIDVFNNTITSEYTLNEGWQSRDIALGKSRDFTINTEGANNTSAQKPVLEFRINSRSDDLNASPDHNLVIEVKPSGSGSFRTVYNEIYNGFKANIASIPLEWSDLGSDITVRVSSKGTNGTASDIHNVAYLRVKYPKTLNVTNQVNKAYYFSFITADTSLVFSFSKSKLFNTSNFILYDLENGFISYPSENINKDSVRFYMRKSATASRYILLNTDTATIGKAAIKPVTFNLPDLSEDYNYLIVTHKLFANAAQEYKAYKETQKIDTGNFKVLVAYVDELYDQFFYGVKSPAAIQNFNAFVYNKQASKPQYLLLLGKGYEVPVARIHDTSSKENDKDYVPAIGNPPSELLYTTGIDVGFQGLDLTLDPLMAVGRIAARSDSAAMVYLQKLKEYNNEPKALWKKRLIHVGGGQALSLQQQAKSILNGTKNIAEGDSIGARVNSYFAENSDVINIDKKAAIQKQIESGSGMLTYFGHAAGTVLGVAIADFPTLKNKNKYPIMYLNGCNVGNPSLPNTSMADDYLFTPDKGSVSWISHSNTSYINILEAQMDSFYTYMSKDLYGGTVGQVWSKVLSKYSVPDPIRRAAGYAWIIQGDPALRFPFLPETDYAISDTSIHMAQADVDATAETFQVAIPVSNLGKTDTSSITIVVKQELPDGIILMHDAMKIPPIRFADTVFYTITKGSNKLQGLNKFDIIVDSDSAVAEIDETNNTAHFEFYFPGTGIRLLYPLNYSIEPTTSPELVAQSRDLFDTISTVLYEIDTAYTFNSPWKQKSGELTGKNIFKWKPNLLPKDSTVYFWRARLNLPDTNGGSWETRSFTYINNSPEGWSQSHFGQYKGITGANLFVDTLNRKFNFTPLYSIYELEANAFEPNRLGILPENDFGQTCGLSGSTIAFIEYDKNTLAQQGIGTPRCGGNLFYFYQFNMLDAASRANFVKQIDSVKPGNYVNLISRGRVHNIDTWEPEVFKAFEKIGSKMLSEGNVPDTLMYHDTVAFVIAGVKGEEKGILLGEQYKYDTDPSQINEDLSDVAYVRILQQGVSKSTGSITSEVVGQASKWKTVYQHYRAIEPEGADNYFLQVLGTDSAGKEEILIDSIKTMSYDISSIDAKKHPFIRLRAYLKDSTQRTPPQLKMWTVIYDGIPEGTLLVDKNYKFENTQLAQGDSMFINIRYENISRHPMTDVVVLHQVQDNTNSVKVTDYDTLKPLQPGEFVYINKSVSTAGLIGNHIYSLRVNPDFQQPEITLDNNIIRRGLNITTDIANPILDVTFDGRHIINYDFVSSNVNIEVTALEENSASLLTDTANFTLMLNRSEDSVSRPVYFSNPYITFTPASFIDNKAHITLKPGPLADGVYYFSAQVKDNSGNKAGNKAYEIYFTVNNKAAISSFYVYPNPVINNARFVFTVTGSDMPKINGIEIYTTSGKLVSFINGSKMGMLHVGSNEISWDGNDMNGNKLTDGLYLYRVNMDGELPVHNLPEDKQMSNGYGKLILMRGR
ncbi:MAG: hypothetical protein EOP53_01255 [Sphingobacteriales bacterium]|nr:MAG: hypothetical protein EOP53_01255 [Sphingobacteriales bacterium]